MIEEFLARLLGGPQGPPNMLASAGLPQVAPSRFDDRGSLGDPGVQAILAAQRGPAPMQAPQMPPQAMQAPQQAPAPSQGIGGGLGSFIQGLFNPGGAQKNQTIGWLTQQGMDEGTATLLAGHKPALQSYLLNRTKGVDPKDALEAELLRLQIDEKRNPRMDPAEEARIGLDREKFSFERSNADKTDDIREYQAYRRMETEEGREALPMLEWEIARRRAGATNIDNRQMGAIPPGYTVEYDDQGRPARMAPIPGGPAATEADAASNAAQVKDARRGQTTDIVTQDIDRALSLIDNSNLPTTGLMGDWLSAVGGTAARDLKGLLDTVKANSGFEALQSMRESSPTGGALGQVTERELAFLQSTIGNLEQSQSPQQLRDNLNRVWNAYQSVIHGEGAFQPRDLSFNKKAAPEGGDLMSMPPPEGIDPNVWKFVPPEKRKLWQ